MHHLVRVLGSSSPDHKRGPHDRAAGRVPHPARPSSHDGAYGIIHRALDLFWAAELGTDRYRLPFYIVEI